MEFDYHKFLVDTWGEPERLVTFLHAYGRVNANYHTVNQWFRRKSVPSNWFAVLLALLEIETGKPVSLVAYLT